MLVPSRAEIGEAGEMPALSRNCERRPQPVGYASQSTGLRVCVRAREDGATACGNASLSADHAAHAISMACLAASALATKAENLCGTNF
jgi:hypothetical protein